MSTGEPPQTTLCTLKIHTTAIAESSTEQVTEVDLVVAGQSPQREVRMV